MYTSQKVLYGKGGRQDKICLDKWWSGILQVPSVYIIIIDVDITTLCVEESGGI